MPLWKPVKIPSAQVLRQNLPVRDTGNSHLAVNESARVELLVQGGQLCNG